jgi:hypothetical protein
MGYPVTEFPFRPGDDVPEALADCDYYLAGSPAGVMLTIAKGDLIVQVPASLLILHCEKSNIVQAMAPIHRPR